MDEWIWRRCGKWKPSWHRSSSYFIYTVARAHWMAATIYHWVHERLLNAAAVSCRASSGPQSISPVARAVSDFFCCCHLHHCQALSTFKKSIRTGYASGQNALRIIYYSARLWWASCVWTDFFKFLISPFCGPSYKSAQCKRTLRVTHIGSWFRCALMIKPQQQQNHERMNEHEELFVCFFFLDCNRNWSTTNQNDHEQQ